MNIEAHSVDTLAVLRHMLRMHEIEGGEAFEEGRRAIEDIEKIMATLAKVISLAHVGKRRSPRWGHVGDATSHGSTVSASLCRQFGLDPDEVVGGKDPVTWSTGAAKGERDGCE